MTEEQFIEIESAEYILVPQKDCRWDRNLSLPYHDATESPYCPLCRKPRWISLNPDILRRLFVRYVPLDIYGRYAPRFRVGHLLPATDIRVEFGLKPGKEKPSNIGDLRLNGQSVRVDGFGFEPIDECKCSIAQENK